MTTKQICGNRLAISVCGSRTEAIKKIIWNLLAAVIAKNETNVPLPLMNKTGWGTLF